MYKIQWKVNIPYTMHQPNWRKQTTTKNNMHQASTKHKAHAQSNVFEQATMGEEVSQQWTSSWPVYQCFMGILHIFGNSFPTDCGSYKTLKKLITGIFSGGFGRCKGVEFAREKLCLPKKS